MPIQSKHLLYSSMAAFYASTLDPEFDTDAPDFDYVAMRYAAEADRLLPLQMHVDSVDPLPSLQMQAWGNRRRWSASYQDWVVREQPYTPPIRRPPFPGSPDYVGPLVKEYPYMAADWEPWAQYIRHDGDGRHINWAEVPPEVQAEIDAYIERRYGPQ